MWQKYSSFLPIRGKKIKIIMRYHFIPVKLAHITKGKTANGGVDMEAKEPTSPVDEMSLGSTLVENNTGTSQNNKCWISIWPSSPLTGIYPKDTENVQKRSLYSYVYCSTIHNSQNLQWENMSKNKWLKKVFYIHMCMFTHMCIYTYICLMIFCHVIHAKWNATWL